MLQHPSQVLSGSVVWAAVLWSYTVLLLETASPKTRLPNFLNCFFFFFIIHLMNEGFWFWFVISVSGSIWSVVFAEKPSQLRHHPSHPERRTVAHYCDCRWAEWEIRLRRTHKFPSAASLLKYSVTTVVSWWERASSECQTASSNLARMRQITADGTASARHPISCDKRKKREDKGNHVIRIRWPVKI